MNLKKCIVKNTWYLTCGFILFSIATNIAAVQIAKKIELVIAMLEQGTYEVFMQTVGGIFALCLLYILCNFIYYTMYLCVEQRARKIAVEYGYRNYLQKDLSFFSETGTGDISYSITALAPEVGSYYATFWQMLLVNAITLIVLFATIASYNLLFAVMIMVGVSLLILCTSYFSNKIADKTVVSETFGAEINDTIVQSFQGISIIKMLKREPYFFESYREGLSKKKYKNDIHRNVWYSLYVVFYNVMIIILPIVILMVGFLLRQKDIISIGAVIAIYSLVGQLQEPIRNIADSVTYYKEHQNRVKKLGEWIPAQELPEVSRKLNSIELKIDKLAFDDVTVLENMNFKVQCGEIVSLIGPSGCGKSTLLKMILGFMECPGCVCYYDGIPQDKLTVSERFQNIALVEQSSFLFSASILENITLGETFTDEQMNEIIHVCVLETLVERYGLDKVIDWAGGNISGGEMQRVATARILIRKPRFLLLDEVTASLDEATSKQIAANIVNYARKYDIAVIAVSHKNEFTELSDRVVSLHKTR